jgi:muramoyltetrapeptide carboxypeptidase
MEKAIRSKNMNKIKKLTKGSTLGLICPAGSISEGQDVSLFITYLNNLGYHVKVGKSVYAKMGYLGGSDDIRTSDIMEMFKDDNIDGILCYKGGYGCSRIIDKLDFEEIAKHPKLLMGFSDITVLLNAVAMRCAFPTVHGQMGVCITPYDNALKNIITNKNFEMVLSGNSPLIMKNTLNTMRVISTSVTGIAQGILVGGNLSLIYAMMGTPFDIDVKDKILFIEEVDEQAYAVDRMFASLRLSGKLDECAGVILGYFTRCEDNEYFTINRLIEEYFAPLNKPVLAGFESGHYKPFINLPIGIKVEVNTNNLSVTALESLFIE